MRDSKIGQPPKLDSYSNHSFDWTQTRAIELTDADRAAGRPAPQFGYSRENFARAERECCEARHGKGDA